MNTAAKDQSCFKPHSCSTCAHNTHTSVLVPLVHTMLTHWFLFHLCTQRSHNGSCSTCACNTQASVLAPLVRTTHTHISLICYDWRERVMSVHGTTKHSMCNYSVHWHLAIKWPRQYGHKTDHIIPPSPTAYTYFSLSPTQLDTRSALDTQ